MITERQEVKTYVVNAMCECGGKLNRDPDAPVLTSYPPQYSYICDKCGKSVLLTAFYPSIQYEELPTETHE